MACGCISLKHVMTLSAMSAAVFCLSLCCAGSYCSIHAVSALVSQKAKVGAFCRDSKQLAMLEMLALMLAVLNE